MGGAYLRASNRNELISSSIFERQLYCVRPKMRGLPTGLHRPCVGGNTTECYWTIVGFPTGLHRPRVGGTTTECCAAPRAPDSIQSWLPPTRGRWGPYTERTSH